MKRLLPVLALLLPAIAAAEEAPISFAEFSIARTRVEKKVWADSVVKNSAGTPVTALNMSMVCLEGSREVARSKAVEIEMLAGGAESRVSFEIPKCPFFTSYIIETACFFGGKELKTRFLGRDLFNPPLAERTTALPGVSWIEVYSLKFDRADKDVKVSLKAKNAGELPSNLARVRFKFYDADQNLVREVVCDFQAAFEYGKEVSLESTVRDVPEYAHARADIVESTAQERRLPEGEFTGDAEVEAAGFRFEERQDGSIRVSGRVRNGKPVGVRNVVVKIALLLNGQEVREVLATPERALDPDEMAPFSSTLRNPPDFDDYRYTTAYEEDEDVARADPPPDPKTIDPGRDPEPDPPPSVDPDPAAKTPEVTKIRSNAQAIECKGARWIAGDWVGKGKQSKYRDGFLLLTFQLTDKNGKTDRVAQDGMLEFTFKAPAKKDVVGRIKLEKFAWSKDSRKFTVANTKASDQGYDPDNMVVEIAVLQVPNQDEWNYTLDLKFTSGENDVWEWKGLTEPYRSPAMKPTGKKK